MQRICRSAIVARRQMDRLRSGRGRSRRQQNSQASFWLVSAEGGEPRQLTRGDGSDTRPRWSPDGKSLAFISTRGGKSQVWILPMDGGDAWPLTSLSTEADGVTWAAHERHAALHLAGLSRLRR